MGEIVNRAQKEEKMEQALKKIGGTWVSLEFVFSQHKVRHLKPGTNRNGNRELETRNPGTRNPKPETRKREPEIRDPEIFQPRRCSPVRLAAQIPQPYPWKQDTDIQLVKLSEEDFETLEDHQLQIQNMMGSRYSRNTKYQTRNTKSSTPNTRPTKLDKRH